MNERARFKKKKKPYFYITKLRKLLKSQYIAISTISLKAELPGDEFN